MLFSHDPWPYQLGRKPKLHHFSLRETQRPGSRALINATKANGVMRNGSTLSWQWLLDG